MLIEVHLEGVDSGPLICARDAPPDVVKLGSGELFTFVQRCMPTGTAKCAALYKRGTVEEFIRVYLSNE